MEIIAMGPQEGIPQDLYTLKQVAHSLQKAPATLRWWIRTKRMEAIKVGRTWRVPRKELQRLMQALPTDDTEELT